MTNQNNLAQVRDLAFAHSHFVEMVFYPDAWQSAQDSNRDWEISTFPPNRRRDIPHDPGVYVFVVEPGMFDLPPASGLFYVGKATSLYDRIGSYTGELNKDLLRSRRPHIWRMVNQWDGHLKYYFTTTETVADAEALEVEMLKALRPPFNRQYDAETGQIMRAF